MILQVEAKLGIIERYYPIIISLPLFRPFVRRQTSNPSVLVASNQWQRLPSVPRRGGRGAVLAVPCFLVGPGGCLRCVGLPALPGRALRGAMSR